MNVDMLESMADPASHYFGITEDLAARLLATNPALAAPLGPAPRLAQDWWALVGGMVQDLTLRST